jgi:hypothetical protein
MRLVTHELHETCEGAITPPPAMWTSSLLEGRAKKSKWLAAA